MQLSSLDRNISALDQNRLLRLSEVIRITGLSRSYIYALSSTGRFPLSIPLVPGGTSRAWVYAEVSDWINQRILARAQEVANG